MPIWLIILLGILALLAALIFVPFCIECTFAAGEAATARIRLRVLGIPFTLFSHPKKQKLPDLKKFRIRALRKRGRKLKRDEDRAQKNTAKKAEKKQRKANKKAAAKAALPPKTPSEVVSDLLHLLKFIRTLAGILLGHFGRYLRVKIRYLDIRLATEDAAKTAMLYGSVYAALETLWTVLSDARPLKGTKKSDISLTADFCGEKPCAKGCIEFRLAVWQLIVILIRGGAEAIRFRGERKKKESAAARALREKREAEARAEVLRDLKS